MVNRPYFPKQGDFIALSFDPQAGHEQSGRRPALVVSKEAFQRATGLVLCCPITNTNRGIPFHVPIPAGHPITGFMMVDQLKSLDLAVRRARFIAAAPSSLLEDVLAILDACIY
ncbi:MAG: type II toxin-antitoxin system PemK/MazF family toxin [Verrucomicrobia bacterium]|nr:type II toxin-antitoxin system PemK/MazF family toxin [Verrucomicrobiota bacterium]